MFGNRPIHPTRGHLAKLVSLSFIVSLSAARLRFSLQFHSIPSFFLPLFFLFSFFFKLFAMASLVLIRPVAREYARLQVSVAIRLALSRAERQHREYRARTGLISRHSSNRFQSEAAILVRPIAPTSREQLSAELRIRVKSGSIA
jgi:hypothetical protein